MAWLQRHEGRDLGDLGSAVALRHYLDRDYVAAVAALDAIAAKELGIADAEHRSMCRRVYLNAPATEGRAGRPDQQQLARWGEAAAEQEAALYGTFVERFGIPYPIVFAAAGVARERFGVSGIPAVFVLDARAGWSARWSAARRSARSSCASSRARDADRVRQVGRAARTYDQGRGRGRAFGTRVGSWRRRAD